jgi:hypothetical protein
LYLYLIREIEVSNTKEGQKVETTTGITVYTQDEYDNAVATAKLRGMEIATGNDSLSTLNVFKEQVRDGSLGRDYATGLYNEIAEACGWDSVSSIASTYSVDVIYNNDVIGTFSGIEADSEDEAQDKVMDDLEVSDAVLSFTVSCGSDSLQGEIYPDTYDITTDIELRATEEEV